MNRLFSICVICMACCTLSLSLTGCGRYEKEAKKNPVMADKTQDHAHTDELTWIKKDIDQDGYKISLGHHGKPHFHYGDRIEAAAMITKDGQDVGDAVVHVSLVSDDKETVLVAESKTTFEPKTDEEPAHYAQATLQIPKEATKFLIRFKLELPGATEPVTLDIDGEAH